MAVDNSAKSNGRGGKGGSSRSRSQRTTKAEATVPSANEIKNTAKVEDAEIIEQDQVTAVDTGEVDISQPVTNEAIVSETTMSTESVVKVTERSAADEKQGAIALSQPSLMVWNRPVMPSEFEIAETISDAGLRPIEVSHLELAGSFLNGRPIEASHLKVQGMLPGNRPVFDSPFRMVDGALLPGNRPIMASDPSLLAASLLPGNRPIASNENVDPVPAILMGYLD